MQRMLAAFAALCLVATSAHAQWRVGNDSASRWTHYGRSIVYGTALGFGYAGIDQWRKEPPEWGDGWDGYKKRAASNIGEFVIQESVTEGLAAAMHRPVDYQHCHCGSTMKRIGWAIRGAVTDPMPNGSHPLAVPRIVGAYAGSFAQASWRPSDSDRTTVAIVNGTTSIALGALINLFYEFR
ncbi:MAG TPA: hypothetical protein VGM82_11135 [Gemmatimonadaceae bacterium]|jgi:hypothetical protein